MSLILNSMRPLPRRLHRLPRCLLRMRVHLIHSRSVDLTMDIILGVTPLQGLWRLLLLVRVGVSHLLLLLLLHAVSLLSV